MHFHCHTPVSNLKSGINSSVPMWTSIVGPQLYIRPGPQMAQVANGQVQRDAHLACHDDEAHIPSQSCHDEQQPTTSLGRLSALMNHVTNQIRAPATASKTTHFLQLPRSIEIALHDLPVGPGQHPRCDAHQQEDGRKHGVDLASEEEEGELRVVSLVV